MVDLRTTLNESLCDLGFNQADASPLRTPLTIDFYEKWINDKNHASMEYLFEHLEQKRNPHLLNNQLSSVISVSQPYYPLPRPAKGSNLLSARMALYAHNDDYHHWLKEKLLRLIERLQNVFPNEIFLPYVDSGPVLERNWAFENRLGWFGKNTCLIHPKNGSLFFIAEILTSIKVSDIATPHLPDFCGTCTRCLDICPTQALVEPRKLKSDLCISYWTIEAKTIPPVELRPHLRDWFFGCDLCQTICPWNEKFFRKINAQTNSQISTADQLTLSIEQQNELIQDFRWLLKSSHRQILKKFRGTALVRAGAKGLLRNALIVIANRKLVELYDEVKALNTPSLQELKAWTLSQLC